MKGQQTRSGLQERRDTSPVSPASAEPLNAMRDGSLCLGCNPEESLPLAGGGPHVGVKPSIFNVIRPGKERRFLPPPKGSGFPRRIFYG